MYCAFGKPIPRQFLLILEIFGQFRKFNVSYFYCLVFYLLDYLSTPVSFSRKKLTRGAFVPTWYDRYQQNYRFPANPVTRSTFAFEGHENRLIKLLGVNAIRSRHMHFLSIVIGKGGDN